MPGPDGDRQTFGDRVIMEVILLQKIANLGDIGDRVRVRPGFGRNYLLPGGKATLATAENIARFEARRAELETRAATELEAARARAAALAGFRLSITAKSGSEGKLFGSISTTDIAEACSVAGHRIERAEVRLPGGPIRTVGDHVITLHLHSDIDVEVPLTVIAEE
jgi:large subunit ribosomal protein L9